MNTVFIQQVKILSPGSPFHGEKVDILIEDGVIQEIASKLEAKADKVISGDQLHASPGWLDLRAQFCDPGEEYKEDLNSGTLAAAKGGFTGVALLPPHSVKRDQKSSVLYAKNASGTNGVEILPYGNISVSGKGEHLAEIYDLQQAGAALFTDDMADIDPGLLRRALQYTKDLNTLVAVVPFEHQLVKGGQMHEGVVSTKNGLKAWPDLTETIRIERDLNILRYTGGRIHFSLISSKAGIELIRKAKSEGLSVTCDVAAHHLVYTEEELSDFDTTYKVWPPLRSKEDRKALINAIEDGTIDAICSDHNPQDVEHKEMEFEHASFGIAGISTVLNLLIKSGVSLEKAIHLISNNPRKLLQLDPAQIEVGKQANITIFDPDQTLKIPNNKPSKSPYNPVIGIEVQGKVIATLLGSQTQIQ